MNRRPEVKNMTICEYLQAVVHKRSKFNHNSALCRSQQEVRSFMLVITFSFRSNASPFVIKVRNKESHQIIEGPELAWMYSFGHRTL
jgi:hypothetical protein